MNLIRPFGLVLALCFLSSLRAQTFTQIRNSGPRANCLSVVFLAEGYTAAEATKFQTDAAAKLQVLLGNESWSRFSGALNGFTIFVASAESGADDPLAGIVRDTYFNSSFNTSGIDRLLTIANGAQGTTKALALLTQFVPDWDVVIILVNSTKYGGSGGGFTTTSLNSSSDEIMLHELGHSFALLADEYVDTAAAPNYPPAEYPNATAASSRDKIPWRAFVFPATPIPTASAPNENTVGLFAGAEYRDTYYRPTFNSEMRALGRPFGPVNLRAYANAVHRFNLNLATVPPVVVQQPAGSTVTAGQNYTLHVVASGAGPLTYQWRFNGVYLATGIAADFPIVAMNAAQAGVYSVEVTNAVGTTASAEVSVLLPGNGVTAISLAPPSAVTVGQTVSLTASTGGLTPLSYQWGKDGASIAGATNSTLVLSNVKSTDAGSYTVAVTTATGYVTSDAAMVGVPTTSEVIGAGTVLQPTHIQHPNGKYFDQILLTGTAETITAVPGQVARTSYIDLNNDIVQVEFSGAGTLSLVLDGASGPAAPVNYNQPSVLYMKGHAGIVITGADETTNVSVFSVGRLNANDPTGVFNILLPPGPTNNPANNGSPLFSGRAATTYDGVADIAYIAISSANGKFGGLRASDASCFATRGLTGIYAPGVQFLGPVYVGDISASDDATPVFVVGSSSSDTWITGGALLQANGQPVKVSGVTQLKFMAGATSNNVALPARANQAVLLQNGADVTTQIAVNP